MPDASGRARPATISLVAAQAGVSRATVSRVLNGRQSVDPAIAERVNAVIAALDYRPSAIAQNLSRGRTQTVAVLVPDLGNPMFQAVLRGVTSSAARDGYRVLVADSEESEHDEAAIALDARGRCDALVLCAPRMPQGQLLALLPRLAPVVVINRELDGVAGLGVDYAHAAGEAIDHLALLGHRRILYLAGPLRSASNERRRSGIAASVARNPGVTAVESLAGSGIDDGVAAAETVLAAGVTAVLAFNDLVAFGLLSRLRQLGIAVPGAISVVGFDDIPFARHATPPLTTASVDVPRLGELAWQRLRGQIAGDPAPDALMLRPSLVLRESTAPPPGAS